MAAIRTVLIVDDELHVRSALSRILQHDGYTVLTAADGEEALQLLATETIQVVLTDQNMPGLVGTDLLDVVTERHPAVFSLVITGGNEPDVRNRYRVIHKPWNNAELRTILHLAFQVVQLEEEKRRLVELLEEERTTREQPPRSEPG